LLLLLCLSLRLTSDRIASSRNEYTAGERFSTETLTSSHVSLFLSSKEGVNEDTVDSFRQSMEQTFLTDSILSGGGRLYLDAFCGFSTLSLSTDRGSTEAAAGYVSGDFFYFHPVELLNGSYLPSEPIDPTLILLDERAAWILFGALDIAGFTCKVNGEIFTVVFVQTPDRPENAVELDPAMLGETMPATEEGFWPVPVTTGISDTYDVEITEGLEPEVTVFTNRETNESYGW